METIMERVLECVRFLADADTDYAGRQNGRGYRQGHSEIGHSLAAQETLSPGQLIYAAKMVRVYERTQLIPAGLTVPSQHEVEAYAKTCIDVKKSKQEHKEGYRIFIQNQRIAVKTPFYVDELFRNVFKPLKDVLQSRFTLFGQQEWSYPLKDAAVLLEYLDPYLEKYGFELPEDIEALVEESRQARVLARQQEEIEQQIRERETKRALDAADALIDSPLLNGNTPFQHQKEAVLQIITWRSAILAHAMGLGKSVTALITARAYGLPTYVICPASLQINWLREAEIVGMPIEVYSWSKIPDVPENVEYTLIADEAHYAKNLQTQRTKRFLQLAESAYAVIPITGTPDKNGRPIELLPLLIAIKHPIAQNQLAYKKRYCDNGFKTVAGGREIWDVTGAINLEELGRKIKDQVLYKKKSECMDLPEKIRKMQNAEVSADAAEAYEKFIQERLKNHQSLMQTKEEERKAQAEIVREKMADLREQGIDPEKELPLEELALLSPDMDSAADLVNMGARIHAASLAKVETATAIAEEVLAQGESIILFTTFKDSGQKLADALHCDFLSGDLNPKARQVIIDRFNDDEAQVLVMTIGAGGVGYTLHKSNTDHPTQTVVLLDRPWSPGDAVQAEDRIHRIGLKNAVTAIWLQFGPLDEKIDALLAEKQRNIDLIHEGKPARQSRNIESMAKEILYAIESGISSQALLEQMYQGSESAAEMIIEPSAEESAPVEEKPVRIIEHKRGKGTTRNYTVKSTDGRLKGGEVREVMAIRVSREVKAFLQSKKNTEGNKGSGYSNYIEELVMRDPEFADFMKSQI